MYVVANWGDFKSDLRTLRLHIAMLLKIAAAASSDPIKPASLYLWLSWDHPKQLAAARKKEGGQTETEREMDLPRWAFFLSLSLSLSLSACHLSRVGNWFEGIEQSGRQAGRQAGSRFDWGPAAGILVEIFCSPPAVLLWFICFFALVR